MNESLKGSNALIKEQNSETAEKERDRAHALTLSMWDDHRNICSAFMMTKKASKERKDLFKGTNLVSGD